MNRLSRERSPYLLQHADNPVDWHPWGDEAFELSRREDKPIFLSIGYSTCHWCHVMAHESFEDAGIAERLNRDFISVKVDREERPDVDRVYMSFVQATTGQGGWPMTVFLTPELKPFFGGTYFPPSSRWGRPGFSDLLDELARVWKHDRDKVEHAAGELLNRLRVVTGAGGHERPEALIAGPEALDAAIEQFQQAYDRKRGGFGDAPKFPRPSELLFLLREHARRSQAGSPPAALLAMVTGTLKAMALGGMRDHIGGGFHRYAVDGDWRVPHFEKMLYDQAQLALAYLEAGQATGDSLYLSVAEDTLDYVLRDMTGPGGGFYSAEDADSAPPDRPGAPKSEGAFYIWTDAEIEALLGADAPIARARFGILPDGNAPADPHGEFTGRNLLYAAASVEDVAASTGRAIADVEASLDRARAVLFEARGARPRPHLDDKVLTAWNGLMIAALARAARVQPDRPSAGRYLDAAQRAATFIRTTLWQPASGTLLRRYRDGEAAIEGYAEDYAYLAWGLLELFQADGDAGWLEWAIEVQDRLNERFWDEGEGGWFSTTGADPTILLRLKEEYDGAEPAATSIATLNALTIANLAGDEASLARAGRTLARYGPRVGAAARVVPMMLCALSAWHAGYTQVVIAGAPSAPATRALATEAARHYLPFAIQVPLAPGARQDALRGRLPFVASMGGGEPAAYVCRQFTCRQPVATPEALGRELSAGE